MYAVILSNAAQTDLDNIVRHIAVDNPTVAEKLGLDLIDVAMSLETLPYRGSRVQELVSLKTSDLRLAPPPSVTFFGKGRKERICPLWPETAQLLKQHLDRTAGLSTHEAQTVFRNKRGNPLTRFGARLILRKHVERAAQALPSLKRKRIHPHSLRHSTAVHLLKSGVDLSTIAHWLGHSSIMTTHKYVAIDLEAKRNALAKVKPVTALAGGSKRWNT